MEISLPDLNMTAVKLLVNGDSVKVSQMGQSPSLDEEERKEIKEEAALFPELDYTGSGYKLDLTSIKNVDGKDAYAVKVTYPSGDLSTCYYEVSTGYTLKETRVNTQGESNLDFGDYRDVKWGSNSLIMSITTGDR